jgi:hypothetical protein
MLVEYQALYHPRDLETGKELSSFDSLAKHWRASDEYQALRYRTWRAADGCCLICGVETTDATGRGALRPRDGTMQHLRYPPQPFSERILYVASKSLSPRIDVIWLCWGCHKRIDAPDIGERGQLYASSRDLVMARIRRIEIERRRRAGDQLSFDLDDED